MSHDEHIGAFVRSVPEPRQANDPDITVVSLDLHRDGFVVQCEIGGSRGLTPTGPVSLDLRDSLYTRYERVGHGEDFIAYKPAIPADAEWLKVYTSPETHIDLGESNSRSRVLPVGRRPFRMPPSGRKRGESGH